MTLASLRGQLAWCAQYLATLAAYVWAGSQVTKPARLWGAVALAPLCERTLKSIQQRLGIRDINRAFWFCVISLWGGALVFYCSLLLATLVRIM